MLSAVAISALLVAASVTPSLTLPIFPTSGREAVNWKDVASDIGKTPLHFEHPYVTRAFEDELMTRADGSEAPRIEGPFEANKFPVYVPTFVPSHATRDIQLMARAEPMDRVAFDVNHVVRDTGRAILNFLREEDPIMARAFEDELMARAELAGSEGVIDSAFARRSGKAPATNSGKAPAQKPSQAPAPKSGKAPAPKSGKAPARKSSQGPAPKSGEVPAPQSGNAPAPKSGGAPVPKSGEVPAPQSGKAPAAKSGNAPAAKSGKAPAAKSGKAPAPQSGKAPVAKSGNAPAAKSGKAPVAKSGNAPAAKSGKAPAAKSGKAPAPQSGNAPAAKSGNASAPPTTSSATTTPQAVTITWSDISKIELSRIRAADCGGEDPKTWHENKVHAFVSANAESLPGVTNARVRHAAHAGGSDPNEKDHITVDFIARDKLISSPHGRGGSWHVYTGR